MSVQTRAQTSSGSAPKWLEVLKGVFIRLFVAMHIVGIVVWALPRPPKAYLKGGAKFGIRTDSAGAMLQSTRDLLSDGTLYFNEEFLRKTPLKYYVLSTGFWQYWDMFSPNPASTDIWGDAEVVYKDGSSKRYPYPRMYVLPLPEKYLKERYRKFFERANLEDKSFMWPFFAQHVAQLSYTDPKNPPVTVRMTRHWQHIAPPGQTQGGYEQFTFFEWRVDQQALVEHRQVNTYSITKVRDGFYQGWALF